MSEDLTHSRTRTFSVPRIEDDIMEEFKSLIKSDVAVPVCAMKALVTVIKRSTGTTWMQLEHELRSAILALKECKVEDLGGRTNISLGSGCELFMKYVTRSFLEYTDFNATRQELVLRGEKFAGMSMSSRSHIANIGHSFIKDGFTILIHGNSRVVSALVLKASQTKQFRVMVTEGRPINDGHVAAKAFSSAGIPTTLILDCAVGTVMDRVDLCLCGAEGVMENGGIVNKIGTYLIAMTARTLKRPFYVAVESYKFARMYPLGQRDAVDLCEQMPVHSVPSDKGDPRTSSASATAPDSSTRRSPLSALEDSLPAGVELEYQSIDFTPAEYITLLFTDLGVLTPSAVSDELIRLYQ